jgi:hypothetical protein
MALLDKGRTGEADALADYLERTPTGLKAPAFSRNSNAAFRADRWF